MEKVPSAKGPPRQVYSLNDRGREYLDAFWKTWSFPAERLEQHSLGSLAATGGKLQEILREMNIGWRWRAALRLTVSADPGVRLLQKSQIPGFQLPRKESEHGRHDKRDT
ncbi:hypothetical protein [Spongiactinospora sp. 9N601]|uniref:hypothetical protein n=1 Tax=Spongiactinospora sp. 9N601 TaxID=3375149 RepID=UPI0037950D91